jgi:K+-transporting ATPase ATPase C chain
MRRQLLTGLIMMIVLTVLVGFVYPFVVTGVAQVAFKHRANDSLVKRNGKVIGSSMVGQSWSDKDGNPLVQYFQPRPSAASGAEGSTSNGYDPSLSSASNLGPSNPKLIGNIPGVSIDTKKNPYASPSDPYCLPVQATDKNGNDVTDKNGNPVYEKNKDGTYVCDSNTVPERVMAYRQLNGLPSNAPVPVDAVTSSGSGLDPDISVANALDQVARVANARHLSVERVKQLIAEHTDSPQWGFLGEKTVNVLDLNLALDKLSA